MGFNQNLQKESWYWCSLYSFLNAILYTFAVELEERNILGLGRLMVFLGYILPRGAIASIIFPALMREVRKQTKLNIDKINTTILKMDPDKGYILGFKYETRSFLEFAKDGDITKLELLNIKEDGKTGYHFIFWKKGVVIDSIGGIHYKLSYENLVYAYRMDMFYPACRTLYAKGDKAKVMQKKLISLAKRKGHATEYENFLNLL